MRWIKGCLQIVLVLGVVLLTGCLQYDLDIQFDSQTHGQWVQQLRWRGSGISASSTLEPWLHVLTQRTQAVQGKLRVVADNTLEITVPFNNGKEFETRFNQFFSPLEDAPPMTLPGGEPIQAELSIRQGNWLLAIDNHISLRIDLTAVPDLTDTALPLLQVAQLLEGRVTVTTPWGVRSPTQRGASPEKWPLVAGEVNQIEADFWVPSPIGIGALVIVVLVALGYSLKYRFSGKPIP